MQERLILWAVADSVVFHDTRL